ncbi:MAG: HEAT repeat domain-containing protein, partial [candidate division WOR-3 bacterium]
MSEEVEELGFSFAKTVKAAQIYGTSHPQFLNFYNSCYQRFVSFLKEYHTLNLQIERFSILYFGHTIYEEKEKELSIAFKLFRDGIREISFSEGLSSDEFLIFLETIGQSSKDQDIALNLWECDFKHITFYVVEEEDEDLGYKIPEIPDLNLNYEEKLNEILQKERINLGEVLAVDISPDELKTIKKEIVELDRRPLTGIAVNTLINILKTEKSPTVIESLSELLEFCINKRDFNNAFSILHKLQSYPDINIIEKFENEITIRGFSNIVNTINDRTFSEFLSFIGFFSKRSIPHFLKILPVIAKRERIEAMRNLLAYICQGDPTPVLDLLKEDNIKIKINAVAILGIIKSKEAIPYLLQLSLHPDEDLRIEIIQAFSQMNESKLIVPFLEDPSSRIRIKALQTLTTNRYQALYNKILKKIKNKKFFELDINEQKEY